MTADLPRVASRTNGIFPAGQMLPFSLVTSLFFLWGVPNNLNDVLIRQFMKSFVLTRFEAGLVQSAFYLGYFLLAIPAALLMRRFGYKTGILIGLALFSTGTFLFWPAAIEGKYLYFLGALFVIATGLSFLETASNPFIAQLGEQHSSERWLNFSQAFNPLGAISGVLVGTVFIFSGVELTPAQIGSLKTQHLYEAYLRSETLRVVKPYMVLGTIALLLGLVILRTKFPAIQSEHEADRGDHGSFRKLLRYPHFLLAILTQFMYIGAQVGTWSYFIQYVQEATHEPEKVF
jgi:FHS family L-fucose permease-like MFS transporter